MKDIHDTIVKASDSASSLTVRHEAFAELVIRFQDMAFACAYAYAVLGDAYLAEDVAQDAFVVAWQKLDQLRDSTHPHQGTNRTNKRLTGSESCRANSLN
ncbi:MAG: hypothetical protein LC775_16200 [Acidobacteria bacterium]|nr:hypothetical protein [Acidobacteriota bacterium]